jgi:hypothetical protein
MLPSCCHCNAKRNERISSAYNLSKQWYIMETVGSLVKPLWENVWIYKNLQIALLPLLGWFVLGKFTSVVCICTCKVANSPDLP